MSVTSRDRYIVGRLGSYDVSTVARVDSHLRALRMRLRLADLTDRQRANVRHDLDELLDRRAAITAAV